MIGKSSHFPMAFCPSSVTLSRRGIGRALKRLRPASFEEVVLSRSRWIRVAVLFGVPEVPLPSVLVSFFTVNAVVHRCGESQGCLSEQLI